MKWVGTVECLGVAFVILAAAFSPSEKSMGATVVREQETVIVGGVKEVWQLVWDEEPRSVCGPEDIDEASICPCNGFAYGQQGKLSLVRIRAGKRLESMDLGTLFDDADNLGIGYSRDSGYLQRWPMQSTDWERARRRDAKLQHEIARRSAPKIMEFADYNRDGYPTKFLLQVGTEPCGKRQFVAVGVSLKDRHLHALTSVEHPHKPLAMYESEWKALLKGPGAHQVEDWMCGDHGSEEERDLIVSADHGNIRVRQIAFACQSDGSRGAQLPSSDATNEW